jgi:hypothetical protein
VRGSRSATGLRARISLILIALYLLEERVDAVLARPRVLAENRGLGAAGGRRVAPAVCR